MTILDDHTTPVSTPTADLGRSDLPYIDVREGVKVDHPSYCAGHVDRLSSVNIDHHSIPRRYTTDGKAYCVLEITSSLRRLDECFRGEQLIPGPDAAHIEVRNLELGSWFEYDLYAEELRVLAAEYLTRTAELDALS